MNIMKIIKEIIERFQNQCGLDLDDSPYVEKRIKEIERKMENDKGCSSDEYDEWKILGDIRDYISELRNF